MLWLIWICIIAAAAGWHVFENKTLRAKLQTLEDTDFAHWMLHLAWLRTLQLLAVIVCAGLVIISYHNDLTQARSEAQTHTDKLKEAIAELESTQQKAITDAVKAQSAEDNNKLVASVKNTPAPAPAPVTAAANPVEEIYSPEKTSTDTQSAMDAVKKRYEDILVIYMFLKQCGKTQPQDYGIITHALLQEIALLKAPAQMQYDILTAADGSYKELYAQSACNGSSIDALISQYNNYLLVLAKNFPQ